jgi:hypothetical protein
MAEMVRGISFEAGHDGPISRDESATGRYLRAD